MSSYPPLDAPVTTVTLRDLAKVYARPRMSNVHIGRLRHNRKVPAFVLTDSLLGKHFAVLGTTGAGKSCAVTVILRSILDEHPHGHVILLDPHNEYASAFADKAELLNPSNLQLPYWLLNFEEIVARPDRRPRAASTSTPRARSSRTPSCTPRSSSPALAPRTACSRSTRPCPTACPT